VFFINDDTYRGKTLLPVFKKAVDKLTEIDLEMDRKKSTIRSIHFTNAEWKLHKSFIQTFFKPIEDRPKGDITVSKDGETWSDIVIVSMTGVKGTKS